MSTIALVVMLLNIVLGQVEGIVVKEYGKRHKIGGMFFNAIICAFAGLFFVIKEGFFTDTSKFYFPLALMPYALLSCIMYAVGFYTMYRALQLGSFGMTKLIASFSMVITIVYGIAFLGERPHPLTYIAMALVCLSVVLMRIEGVKENKDDKSDNGFSLKWLVYLILCVVSNGFISILTRQQQIVFDGICDCEFKMISTFGACILLMMLGFILEKQNLGYIVKHGSLYGAVAGLVNGGKNFLHLIIYNLAAISISTPMTTGVGLVISFLLSIFLYKEKFTKLQAYAAGVGFVAFILFQVAAEL